MAVNPSDFTEKQQDVSTFKEPFLVSQNQVSARLGAQKRVMGDKDTSRHPVERVSWDDATDFCRRLSALPSEHAAARIYRLPTEAEWEYACRAGTTTRRYCGDEEDSLFKYAWLFENSGGMTHPVGEKKPNAWGLYDMNGNVWQWCHDWYGSGYYVKSATEDPEGNPRGLSRVRRGGAWNYAARKCRSGKRFDGRPGSHGGDTGLRVALVLDDTALERAKISGTTDGAEPSRGATVGNPLTTVPTR